MTEKYIKGDVVKVVGGKSKGEMGVVVCPTKKMYYIRLNSHKEVRFKASSVIKEKKRDAERSIAQSFEAAEKIESADTKAIETAEKISEICARHIRAWNLL
jgi:ribosomal protein L24